jgi:hypothetical protein
MSLSVLRLYSDGRMDNEYAAFKLRVMVQTVLTTILWFIPY